MAVETLGEMLDLGWRLHARCAWGKRGDDSMKSKPECSYGAELDLRTLVWTRGRDFPADGLSMRLRCPRCGSRKVRIAFSAPASTGRARAAAV